MKTYNLGIIGYGSMANNHRLQLEKGNVPVKLKGVYDIDSVRMALAREQGYHTYTSQAELLNDSELDMVLIAATNEVHADLAIAALRARKHVICEKPVTMTVAELEEIIAVSKKCGKMFTIDQNRRFNRDYINLSRTIESGVLGNVYHIESRVEGSRGIPKGWRCENSKGGGMLYDWGVHLIDQMLYMIPSPVVSVYCKMCSIHYPEVDDNFRLYLTFENGLTAQIEIATNNFIPHPRFYAFGSEGTLVITDWDGTGNVVKKRMDDNQWNPEIVKVKAGPTKTMAPRDPSTVEIIPLTELTDVVDNLDPVYQQFVAAIEGAALLIKPEEALRVMKVIEAAFASAQTNECIKLYV